jgi:hypothetical protein
LSGFSALNVTAAHLAFVLAEFSSNALVPTGTATLAEFRKNVLANSCYGAMDQHWQCCDRTCPDHVTSHYHEYPEKDFLTSHSENLSAE